MPRRETHGHRDPRRIGDHPALDFLNTAAAKHEYLVDDRAVLDWLVDSGFHDSSVEAVLGLLPGELLHHALALRKHMRALIFARKRGSNHPPDLLNAVLAATKKYQRLQWIVPDEPRRLVAYEIRSPSDLLHPVAESTAELLESGDFERVRKCENPRCSTWFYDRTKGRRRRWCSTATCGNRAKVAAFRARKAQRNG